MSQIQNPGQYTELIYIEDGGDLDSQSLDQLRGVSLRRQNVSALSCPVTREASRKYLCLRYDLPNVHNNIKFNFVKAYTCNYVRLVIGLKTDTKAGTPQ